MDESPMHAALFKSGFEQAYRRSRRNRILDAVRGRSHTLLPFDAVSSRLFVRQRIDHGRQAVPLAHIVGTVGKFGDFDRCFLPIRHDVIERWLSIEQAYRKGVSLPPVELYKVWDIYFVVDGHHRVAVAREQGFVDIEARVIGLVVDVPLTPGLTVGDLERKEQQSDFYEWTNLRQLRPDALIETSGLNAYLDIIMQINHHRVHMSETFGCDVTVPDAVAEWYDTVYLPVVTLIRQRKLLEAMPYHTEADLYICVAGYQQLLAEHTGASVSLDHALDVYVGYVPSANKPWGRLTRRRIDVLPPETPTKENSLLARLRRRKNTTS